MKKTMYIMVGVPGSGKSTWVNENLKESTVICADDIRKALGHTFYIPIEPMVHSLCMLFARAALERGVSVVVDQTNVRARYIKTWVETARSYGYKCKVIVLSTPIEICKERKGNGFPLSVIDKMDRELYEDWEDIVAYAPEFEIIEWEG